MNIRGKTFLPGDQILLKRGDVWTESILLKGNGTASSPILFSAYGTGNRPYLKGDFKQDVEAIATDYGCQGWKFVGIEIGFWFRGFLGLVSKDVDYFWFEDVYFHDCAHKPSNIKYQAESIFFFTDVSVKATLKNVTV